jgi:glycine cleavage system H protein
LNNAAVPVGADDFTCKFVGKIDRIETLPVGVEVKRGQPMWRVLFGDRWIVQRAPVSGRIVVVNQKVLKNPEVLSESPYGDKWIMKILPESLSVESAKLFGKENFMQVADRMISKLLGQLKPALGTLSTDSGALMRGAARQIEEEKWEDISSELFGSEAGGD